MNTMNQTFFDTVIPELKPYAVDGIITLPFFQTFNEAQAKVTKEGVGYVYTWQSGGGGYNKLVSRPTVVDIFGYLILPAYIGEEYNLPDDENNDED